MTADQPLPIIQRRAIEADILAQVHAVLTDRHGTAEADAVIGEAVSNAAILHGKSAAGALGHAPDLSDFLAILPNWTAEQALEIDVLAATPDQLDFNVTRCRYAEMYRARGIGRIGHLLSCNRDGDFCKGYNPDIRFTRTQTLMQGASHCDFRYRLDPPAGE